MAGRVGGPGIFLPSVEAWLFFKNFFFLNLLVLERERKGGKYQLIVPPTYAFIG